MAHDYGKHFEDYSWEMLLEDRLLNTEVIVVPKITSHDVQMASSTFSPKYRLQGCPGHT